jgi:hypothetical protein
MPPMLNSTNEKVKLSNTPLANIAETRIKKIASIPKIAFKAQRLQPPSAAQDNQTLDSTSIKQD